MVAMDGAGEPCIGEPGAPAHDKEFFILQPVALACWWRLISVRLDALAAPTGAVLWAGAL